MPIYSVSYGSMSASFGPYYITATTALEARNLFRGTTYTSAELPLITAREVSATEIIRALYQVDED